MRKESGKIQMSKLALIEQEIAELDARRAELSAKKAGIYAELADGASIDHRTLQRPKTPHRPKLGPVSELDRARARSILRETDIRRRVGP